MKKLFLKYRLLFLLAIIVIAVLAWGIWLYLAFHNVNDKRSEAVMERESWYELDVNGTPLLYYNALDSDSVFSFIDEKRDTAVTRTQSSARWINLHWWWPSCRGRFVAKVDSLKQPQFDVKKVVEKNINHITSEIDDYGKMVDEMDYFLSTHSVQDEGYELVTAYYEKTIRERVRLNSVLEKLKRFKEARGGKIVHSALYKVKYKDVNDSLVVDTAHFCGKHFQLNSRKTPSGVKPISLRKASSLHLASKTITRATPKEEVLNGFGLKVTPKRGVQLGEWKDGKYQGERLEYNTNRIYGIDLSRFQHEKGRKKYRINWAKMRITSLGHISKKRVSGSVDYPVSFCYIKSTEGTSVRNKYYASDYAQARKYGIHVGTYHFFSTRSSGAKQAKFFIRNLHLRKGDLPPVLDIEPYPSQIRKMGGVNAMFRQIRIWLNKVEAATGMRPILYISQTFVNRYLSYAPDIKKNYQVWIARYGEYKPDVHMLYWQLSPDGRVRGITPQVDINVFNGYTDRFDNFLKTSTKQ